MGTIGDVIEGLGIVRASTEARTGSSPIFIGLDSMRRQFAWDRAGSRDQALGRGMYANSFEKGISKGLKAQTPVGLGSVILSQNYGSISVGLCFGTSSVPLRV